MYVCMYVCIYVCIYVYTNYQYGLSDQRPCGEGRAMCMYVCIIRMYMYTHYQYGFARQRPCGDHRAMCMYVCMYVYVYVYIHTYTHIINMVCLVNDLAATGELCVCMYACMHACMHACMYVCMHIYIYIINMISFVNDHATGELFMCVCIYTHVQTSMYMHVLCRDARYKHIIHTHVYWSLAQTT